MPRPLLKPAEAAGPAGCAGGGCHFIAAVKADSLLNRTGWVHLVVLLCWNNPFMVLQGGSWHQDLQGNQDLVDQG